MADDSSEIVKEGAEAVSFENVKTGGGASAFYQTLAMGNAVSNQQHMNQAGLTMTALQTVLIAKAAESLMTTQANEGIVDSGLAEIISKMAGNTPPVTP